MPATTTERTLVLDEYETLPGVQLTLEQAEALKSAQARLDVRHAARSGHYDVRAANVVGVLVAPGLRVTIRPKLPVARLFYLLGYSSRTPTLGSLAPFDEDQDLLEVLAPHFARALAQALSRGLVREYTGREDMLHAVRGRVDLLGLMTHRFGIWPPVPCEFIDHTADTLPNRLLLAATALLRKLTSSADVDATLGALEARMDEVTHVRFPASRVPSADLDRRHTHCEAAVRMAELVLRHMSLEVRAGSVRSTSFLIDMNALYEDFVVAAVGNALHGDAARRWTKHPRGIYLDEARQIRLVPDAMLKDRSRHPVAVVDAKYKVIEGPEHSDIYQMLAYCTRLRLRHAVLVYASTPPGKHRLEGGVTIHRVPFDPGGDIEALEAGAAEIARLVESLTPGHSRQLAS